MWRDERLVVEVDGYRYHRSPSRFESDREKDVTLELKGWRVLRFTVVAARNTARLGGRGDNRRARSRGVVQTPAGRCAERCC